MEWPQKHLAGSLRQNIGQNGHMHQPAPSLPRRFPGKNFFALSAIFCLIQAMNFDACLQETVRTFEALPTIRPQIDRAGAMILRTLQAGHKLLLCGNGGSAAEAQHFATELVGRYFKTRRPLPAIALTADGTLLSCIGNDFKFDDVFARQIEGLAQPGDLVVVLLRAATRRTFSAPWRRRNASSSRASPSSAAVAARRRAWRPASSSFRAPAAAPPRRRTCSSSTASAS